MCVPNRAMMKSLGLYMQILVRFSFQTNVSGQKQTVQDTGP